MARGRRKTRTGKETRSTFDKSPELEIALLDLQRRYVLTGRRRPSMRDLLMDGIVLLLEKEGLPSLVKPDRSPASTVVELSKKGA